MCSPATDPALDAELARLQQSEAQLQQELDLLRQNEAQLQMQLNEALKINTQASQHVMRLQGDLNNVVHQTVPPVPSILIDTRANEAQVQWAEQELDRLAALNQEQQ